MEASIVSIASDVDAKSAGVEASLPSVLRWVGRRNDNWLMIFDGADVGYEVVEAFIPPGKHGNILISSRNTTMNRLSAPSSAYMEVFELDEDAAVELFVKSARLGSLSPAEQCHVEAIVQELCYLALAVDQAGSSIATGVCHTDEYLTLYKQRRRQLMDDKFFNGSSNYGRAVYTTWDISFTELEQRASSSSFDSVSYKAAILLLRIFSFFHFDGIREDIFYRAAEGNARYVDPLQPDSPLLLLLQQTENNEWDLLTFRAGIRILSQFSLIKIDGKPTRTYSMHRLVHRWMQDRLPKSSHCEMALLAATVLARSEGYGETAADYAHCRALLVHLISLFAHLKQAGLVNQLSVDAIIRMARVYHEGGKAADAEVLLRQAVTLLQKDSPGATEQYVTLLSWLGSVLSDLGRLREAEAFKREALEWREKHLGSNHHSTATAKNNLAVTLHDLGDFGQAKVLKIQVLDWRKEYLGMDHSDTYGAMANLASTFRELGELEEARELEMKVLEWRKEHLGIHHPETFQVMGNLACTLYELNELSEAKGLEVQVLDWRKAQLGPNHRLTILAMENLACTLERLGDSDVREAEELFSQVEKLRGATER
jgi:tetratricopeptide (TPR) repeat protein